MPADLHRRWTVGQAIRSPSFLSLLPLAPALEKWGGSPSTHSEGAAAGAGVRPGSLWLFWTLQAGVLCGRQRVAARRSFTGRPVPALRSGFPALPRALRARVVLPCGNAADLPSTLPSRSGHSGRSGSARPTWRRPLACAFRCAECAFSRLCLARSPGPRAQASEHRGAVSPHRDAAPRRRTGTGRRSTAHTDTLARAPARVPDARTGTPQPRLPDRRGPRAPQARPARAPGAEARRGSRRGARGRIRTRETQRAAAGGLAGYSRRPRKAVGAFPARRSGPPRDPSTPRPAPP